MKTNWQKILGRGGGGGVQVDEGDNEESCNYGVLEESPSTTYLSRVVSSARRTFQTLMTPWNHPSFFSS